MTIRPRRSLLNTDLRRPSALHSVARDENRLWLDKNENLDPELLTLTQRVLREIPNLALATYPEARVAYEKLAQWIGVPAESLLLTPGSDGVIRLVFESFIEHGDLVIHTAPTFAMYPVYSKMFGANVTALEYGRSAAGPVLALNTVLGAIEEHRPKLLCLPNPDSPTGTSFEPSALKRILATCEVRGTVLLLDEAYHPFNRWSAATWTQTSPNLIVARTFAKAWGVAGLRVGYAIGHPDTIALIHKMRPMYEISTLAVEFISRLIDHEAVMWRAVERIIGAREYFVDAMRGFNFEVLNTSANFAHVAFGERAQAIHAALSPHVYYRPTFTDACLEGYSRFTIGPLPAMQHVVRLIEGARKSALR